jgi:hypothetical protein
MAGFAVQTAVNGGSELVIFVPRTAHSHNCLGFGQPAWGPASVQVGVDLTHEPLQSSECPDPRRPAAGAGSLRLCWPS